MALRNKASIISTATSRYEDNPSGEISGQDSIDMFTDIADSFASLSDDNTYTGRQTYQNARIVLKGLAAGISNITFLEITDSAGTRSGFVGEGSSANTDIYVSASLTNIRLSAASGSVVQVSKTTTERNALTAVAGMLHYNSTLGGMDFSNGSSWGQLWSNARQTLTDGATVTWNCLLGLNATVTLAGNRTLSITNPQTGMYGTIKVIQDGTGSRTLTLPAGSIVINGGGGTATLTTTAAAKDILSFYYDGTNYFWTIGLNYT